MIARRFFATIESMRTMSLRLSQPARQPDCVPSLLFGFDDAHPNRRTLRKHPTSSGQHVVTLPPWDLLLCFIDIDDAPAGRLDGDPWSAPCAQTPSLIAF